MLLDQFAIIKEHRKWPCHASWHRRPGKKTTTLEG